MRRALHSCRSWLLLLPLVACSTPSTRHDRSADDGARAAIGTVLDDWHDAAAKADEARYFAHFTPDAVFLGTDATERWDLAAFRAYAHPHFAKGKAWTFAVTRRAVIVGADGAHAWFDEDLATDMGPARGSGVLLYGGGRWRLAHYNLTLTIPNERVDDLKRMLGGKPR